VVSQVFNFWRLYWLLGALRCAATMWVGMCAFSLWVNLIQNYWTHDRRFDACRYDDSHNNTMNIADWPSVTASASACLQNNHHYAPWFLRLSDEDWECDFGFAAVKAMKALGLVRATRSGVGPNLRTTRVRSSARA
jgi:fatty-acid desaturase